MKRKDSEDRRIIVQQINKTSSTHMSLAGDHRTLTINNINRCTRVSYHLSTNQGQFVVILNERKNARSEFTGNWLRQLTSVFSCQFWDDSQRLPASLRQSFCGLINFFFLLQLSWRNNVLAIDIQLSCQSCDDFQPLPASLRRSFCTLVGTAMQKKRINQCSQQHT